jgi:hypothetical protein
LSQAESAGPVRFGGDSGFVKEKNHGASVE